MDRLRLRLFDFRVAPPELPTLPRPWPSSMLDLEAPMSRFVVGCGVELEGGVEFPAGERFEA